MRALIVGLGSAGRRHARNWSALGLGEVLVCRHTRRPLPEPLGFCPRELDSLQRALEERPDVVIVTNPTSVHVETARQAVASGAHVLVEKPIGNSLEGVPELLREAQDNKRIVYVGYNLRFHSGLQRLRELLHSGSIGQPLSARAEMGEYLPDWHPWEDYRQAYSARKELGGGPVLTFSHELDSVCWLFGAPRRVMAMTSNASALEIDTEDAADIVLAFDSGMLASVHVDYVRRPPRRAVEIVGEEGVLRWEYDANRLLRSAPGSGEWVVEEGSPTFDRNDMFTAELCDFVARIRGEPSIGADGEQGAAVLSIALAALRSAASGAAVDMAQEPQQVRQWLSSL